MIQRCPNCGQWCEVEKSGIIDRYYEGATDAAEIGGNILGSIGKFLGGKTGEKYARRIGEFGGAAIGGNIGGFSNAVMGDSYSFLCPECGFSWSCDSKMEDQTEEYEKWCQMIALKEQLLDDLWVDNPNIASLQNYIGQLDLHIANGELSDYTAMLYDLRALANDIMGNHLEAYSDVNRSLSIYEDSEAFAIRGLYTLNLLKLGQIKPECAIDALKDLTSIFEEQFTARYYSKQYLESQLNEASKIYVDHFISLSPSRRRYICFTDEIHTLGSNILVLPLGNVPAGLTFPDGLPKKNLIYVVHPFKPNHYIAIDNYEFDLFRDRLDEFKWIMENLGARSISVSIETEREHSSKRKDHTDAHLSAEIKGYSGEINGAKDASADKYDSLRIKLEEKGNFDVGESIQMPEPQTLIWYHHDQDWQRKVESRMSGRRNSLKVTFNSKSSHCLSESESKELEAEMNFIIGSANLGGKTSGNYHIERTENHNWTVNVEFYPLNNYNKESTSSTSANAQAQTQLTTGEQNYLQAYRDCLTDDGEISERERKLLDAISRQNGLTPERAAEIEAFVIIPKKKKSFWKKLFS